MSPFKRRPILDTLPEGTSALNNRFHSSLVLINYSERRGRTALGKSVGKSPAPLFRSHSYDLGEFGGWGEFSQLNFRDSFAGWCFISEFSRGFGGVDLVTLVNGAASKNFGVAFLRWKNVTVFASVFSLQIFIVLYRKICVLKKLCVITFFIQIAFM